MTVGIEALNAYCGQTYLDIRTLFESRELSLKRFDNLMMNKKSVGLPCEDPVTNAVNAAKPILDALGPDEKAAIELVITASESGIDFGKSLSTYIHHHLGLSRTCRLFEVKQACYGGTAALQMAVCFVAANPNPAVKALVIATDVAKGAAKMTYAEPSQGVAAVAMLVGRKPEILDLDLGANGYHSYEVMDTCRPEAEIETGDPDLSLMSYLDCLEGSFRAYQERVGEVDFLDTFDYLAFHTPFGGMVKGAHRHLARKLKRWDAAAVEADFERRMAASLTYGVEVGNVYSASVYLALCGVIDNSRIDSPKRIGLFSYGSGCSSEFYSGIITPRSKAKLAALGIGAALRRRHGLSMAEYEEILDHNAEWRFGIKDKVVETDRFAAIYNRQVAGRGLLVLRQVDNYHREYEWS